MSRIGKASIKIADKVKVTVNGRDVMVEGPKGKLSLSLTDNIEVKVDGGVVKVERSSEEKPVRSMHGTVRALLYNMIVGVSKGFKKELEIVGMGYKVQMKGNALGLSLGFSHPLDVEIPKELKVTTNGPTKIVVEGIDKQLVGKFCAKIRAYYPPEPYKGKGVRYSGEEVRKKLGKAMAK